MRQVARDEGDSVAAQGAQATADLDDRCLERTVPDRPLLTGASDPEPALPTGQQWTIGHGSFEATVVEVGGGLRTLSRDGVDLVAGYLSHERCASGRGQQLMPWPNRIRDGRYTFEGTERQLSITEVPLGNASHGLVRWALWELVELEEVVVTARRGVDRHLGHHRGVSVASTSTSETCSSDCRA